MCLEKGRVGGQDEQTELWVGGRWSEKTKNKYEKEVGEWVVDGEDGGMDEEGEVKSAESGKGIGKESI